MTMLRRRVRTTLGILFLLACGKEAPPDPSINVPHFAGSTACRACHPEAFAAWHGSPHDQALNKATPETVLGDFDNIVFEDGPIRARFSRSGDRYYVETREANAPAAHFEIAYVIGVDPLQQLVIEEPRGHLQIFSVAWDTQGMRWFALPPPGHAAGDVHPGDWLHWTGTAFNANSMCIECHATNVDVGFQTGSRNYQTTWAEDDVGCEACHGPRADHVAWNESRAPRSAPGEIGARGTSVEDRDRERQQAELESCAPCHSRRRRIHATPTPDESFHDRYALELIQEGLYYADGQIRDEVYVLGSFMQSRMYAEGVRCTHCHNPHTLKLVAEGNDLCLRCHETQRYDTPAHHHHEDDSVASRCVECHMRARVYMQIDPRRDHGFHLPRPDQTVEFGVPNACNACHNGRDANWASEHVIAWYGPKRPHDVHAAAALAADRNGQGNANSLLTQVYDDPTTPLILKATVLARLAARGAAQRGALISSALSSSDPLLRATAVAAAEGLPPALRAELLEPLLVDSARGVRIEAARILASLDPRRLMAPQGESDRALSRAWHEFLEIQQSLGSHPGVELNLAIANSNQGKLGEAEDHYLRALALDRDFLPARFNLALLYDAEGRGPEAEAQLRAALTTDPELGEAHYSLGLLLAADPTRGLEAADSLAEAAQKLPTRPRVQYNAGLAQQRLGRAAAAKAFFHEALAQEPGNADFRYALASLAAGQNRWKDARTQALRLIRDHPHDPRGPLLLRRLPSQGDSGP